MAFRWQRYWAFGGIAAAALLALSLAAHADPAGDSLAQARALMDAGKPADAYVLLAAQEAESAGDEDFDYLLGIAALDSGRPAEAVFSLERVLAVDPGFLGARMELARARFDSGDAPGARAQFQYLLAQSPSPATRTVIERYLGALDRRNVARSNELRRYLDLGTGYDSNANGATGSDQFLGFTLDPHSVEASSSFVDVAAGFDHGHGFDNGTALVTQGRLSHRFNPQADFIDLTVGSLGTRLQWAWAGTRFDASASGDVDWLDGKAHQSDLGLGLGLAHRLAGDWDVRLDARALAVRFQQSALKVMDANRWLASAGVVRNGAGSRQARVGALLLVGEDNAKDSGSSYDNERWGARVYAGWSMTQGSTLYAEAAYLATNYADSPGFFGTDRSDRQWSALIATEYQNWPARGWSLAPRIRYVKNDSNVSLYEYDRTEAGIFLRRSFR
jgi:tetratricopeptide (TPR) repeat protein